MAAMSDRRAGVPQLFLAAVIGGLVVFAAGLLLIGTGFIDRPTRSGGDGIASIAPVAGSKGKGSPVGKIYDQASPAVGFITASGGSSSPQTGPGQGNATGSGFLIDRDGHMVTNDHVVAGSGKVSVRLGERDFEAELVGSDPSTDLALLKLVELPSETVPLALGDSKAVEVGDPVVAIGNPFGLDRTATTGIVSALQREIKSTNGYSISDVIQTDASINPGNSGGPLLDSEGRVIGVNSQIATGGGSNGSVGIGFAVPSSTVEDVVGQLLEKGEVDHAWIGISGVDIEPDTATALRLEEDVEGVLVQEVGPGGPADRAGIEPFRLDGDGGPGGQGDVIVAVEGKRSPTMAGIAALVNRSESGDVIRLTVFRDGREQVVEVELGKRPG